MRRGLGLGLGRFFGRGALASPLIIFTAGGATDVIGELRVTLSQGAVVTCSGGISICATSGGTYGTSLSLASGACSIYVKRTSTSEPGYLFVPSQIVTRWGLGGTSGSNTGWRHTSGGEANLPLLTVDADQLSPSNTGINQYIATSSRTVTFIGCLPPTINNALTLHTGVIWSGISGLPQSIRYLRLNSSGIEYTYDQAVHGNLPSNMVSIYCYAAGTTTTIALRTQTLPSTMNLFLASGKLIWEYTGNLHSGLTQFYISLYSGTDIKLYYDEDVHGVLPATLTSLTFTQSGTPNHNDSYFKFHTFPTSDMVCLRLASPLPLLSGDASLPPKLSTMYINPISVNVTWDGWGNQVDFTSAARALSSTNTYIYSRSAAASPEDTDHFLQKLDAVANAVPSTVTLTLKSTATYAEMVAAGCTTGYDALYAKNYRFVLGAA